MQHAVGRFVDATPPSLPLVASRLHSHDNNSGFPPALFVPHDSSNSEVEKRHASLQYMSTGNWTIVDGYDAVPRANSSLPGHYGLFGQTATSDACLRTCAANSSCAVWEWSSLSKNCWLRVDNVWLDGDYEQGRVSGCDRQRVPACPPPSPMPPPGYNWDVAAASPFGVGLPIEVRAGTDYGDIGLYFIAPVIPIWPEVPSDFPGLESQERLLLLQGSVPFLSWLMSTTQSSILASLVLKQEKTCHLHMHGLHRLLQRCLQAY